MTSGGRGSCGTEGLQGNLQSHRLASGPPEAGALAQIKARLSFPAEDARRGF